MPSVIPDHSRRRRQSSRNGPSAFIVSSMNGATRPMARPAMPLLKPRMSSMATEQTAMKPITPASGSHRRHPVRRPLPDGAGGSDAGAAASAEDGAPGEEGPGEGGGADEGSAGCSGDPPGVTSAMQPA